MEPPTLIILELEDTPFNYGVRYILFTNRPIRYSVFCLHNV